MKKRLLLPVAGVAEVVLFVGVLASYLVLIAQALRNVARTLRLIAVGVRAIEKQTDPLGDTVKAVNSNLERAAVLLREAGE